GMRGERLALPCATEIRLWARSERVGIDLVRQPVFLRRVQLAAEDHRRRVRRRSTVRMRDVANARVIGVRVAVVAVELPTRFSLFPIALRLNVAALVARLAALET